MRFGGLMIVALAGLVLMGGCASKTTRKNYSMIREKVDTRQDVRAILGSPKRDMGDQWIYDDMDSDQTIVIYFDANGVVAGKEWADTGGGVFRGSGPDTDEEPSTPPRQRSTKSTTIDR